jgi:hypothetical protein
MTNTNEMHLKSFGYVFRSFGHRLADRSLPDPFHGSSSGHTIPNRQNQLYGHLGSSYLSWAIGRYTECTWASGLRG